MSTPDPAQTPAVRLDVTYATTTAGDDAPGSHHQVDVVWPASPPQPLDDESDLW